MGVSSAQRQRLLNTCPPFPLASKVYVLLKSLQVSALQRLSFQQTPSPKPSSTFPTSFSAQEIKTTARKQPQPAASSEQNSRPLRTPEASAPGKPSLAPCPATPLTHCLISYLRCPEPLRSASPAGCGVQQDHLGHLLKGWAHRHCQGRLPGVGANRPH